MTARGSPAGKRCLVFGIANADSIAAGCARAFAAEGVEIAATYRDDIALPHVRALTDPGGAVISSTPPQTRPPTS